MSIIDKWNSGYLGDYPSHPRNQETNWLDNRLEIGNFLCQDTIFNMNINDK